MELLIKNAHVVSPADGLDAAADILVQDGKIAQIGADLSADCAVLDATGLTAVPGFVDMHVHLRDPGQTAKEDILTGCNAAAAGGVTSLLCMPNTVPTVDNPETVHYIINKAKDANAKVYVAASITKGLKSEEPTDLRALRSAGAVGLSDDGRPVENTKFLRDAMKLAPSLGMTVVAHCEDLFLADGGKINEGAASAQLGVKGIPAAAEDCGTAREIALAAAENSLTEQVLLKRDADYRMNPPLRTQADVAAIIEGLTDGTLDCIATDHAPHTPEEKSDFEKAPNGSVGMETSFAVANTYLVKTGVLTLGQVVEKMSVNPAKLLGIDAGTLAVGAPADIALRLHGKSKNTPFKGMTLTGKVKRTLLGGKTVFIDD